MEKSTCDLLIAGSGAAGVAAALAAQEQVRNILWVSKGPFLASGSTFINRNGRWGITFAHDDREEELLFETIMAVSHGANDPVLSRVLVGESAAAFRRLQEWGVLFLHCNGSLRRVPPCFCSHPLAAIIHDTRQFAGVVKTRIDPDRIAAVPGVRMTELRVRDNRVEGAFARQGPKTIRIDAKAVILATGGPGGNYRPSITEPGLTGDGYQLLTGTGLDLHNMAYHQRVWEDISPEAPRFSTSAFFDDRFSFYSADGKPLRFPPYNTELVAARRQHVPISNLQVDRQIDQVLLDHLTPDLSSAIQVHDRRTGELVNRIYPHFQANNGGIKIGPSGETGIDGLFAVGELTTGMHGGDRIGGMMIASCFVFGHRAGLASGAYLQ